jgi:hypothetical protein
VVLFRPCVALMPHRAEESDRCNGCLDEKWNEASGERSVKGRGQRAEGRERRAESREQRAESGEGRGEGRGQRAESEGRRAKGEGAKGGGQRARSGEQSPDSSRLGGCLATSTIWFPALRSLFPFHLGAPKWPVGGKKREMWPFSHKTGNYQWFDFLR